jgi:hypothetical protein
MGDVLAEVLLTPICPRGLEDEVPEQGTSRVTILVSNCPSLSLVVALP